MRAGRSKRVASEIKLDTVTRISVVNTPIT